MLGAIRVHKGALDLGCLFSGWNFGCLFWVLKVGKRCPTSPSPPRKRWNDVLGKVKSIMYCSGK